MCKFFHYRSSLNRDVLTLLLFFTSFGLFGQEEVFETYKSFVVKVNSYDESNYAFEYGAGIVWGANKDSIYIVTAKHVVQDENNRSSAARINVNFYNSPQEKHTGNIVLYVADMDIAVIRVKNSDNISLNTLCIGEKTFDSNELIYTIGHSDGLNWNIAENQIKELTIPGKGRRALPLPGSFKITTNDINPGNSGGPVFDKDFRLIGIMTKRGSLRAEAIRIYMIQKRIKNLLSSSALSSSLLNICPPLEDDMRYVVGGTFLQGNPRDIAHPDEWPQLEVTLSSFWIDRFEVTNSEFCTFLNDEEINFRKDGKYLWKDTDQTKIKKKRGTYFVEEGYENHPVFSVTWYGANEYAKWRGARLPSEAEWEFAAKGGNQSRGYNYAGSNTPATVAWFNTEQSKIPFETGTKAANELGIYDMSGNVLEWCSDYYHDYSNMINPQIVKSKHKVLRGGSWVNEQHSIRVTKRFQYPPHQTAGNIGFRCVRDIISKE